MPVYKIEYNGKFDISNIDDSNLCILPEFIHIDNNSNPRVCYHQSYPMVLKLFKSKSIKVNLPYGQESIFLIQNNGIDWYGPTLLFSATILSQNPELLNVSLNIISSYLFEIFKGQKKDPNAKLKVIYKTKNKSFEINYEGSASGLNEISKIIGEINE